MVKQDEYFNPSLVVNTPNVNKIMSRNHPLKKFPQKKRTKLEGTQEQVHITSNTSRETEDNKEKILKFILP